MTGRLRSDSDRPATYRFGELYEIEGVCELTETVLGILGRVPAERHQVLDTGLSVCDQDLCQFEPCMCNTDQVGHRGERRVRSIPVTRSKVRCARFAATSVGHRDE